MAEPLSFFRMKLSRINTREGIKEEKISTNINSINFLPTRTNLTKTRGNIMFAATVCYDVFGHSRDNIGGWYAGKCGAAFTVGQSLVTCPSVRSFVRSFVCIETYDQTRHRCIQSRWFTDCWSLRDALGDIALPNRVYIGRARFKETRRNSLPSLIIQFVSSTRCGKSELILWSKCIAVIIFPLCVCFRNLCSFVLTSSFRFFVSRSKCFLG